MEIILRCIQLNIKFIYMFVFWIVNKFIKRPKEPQIPPIRNELLTISVTNLVHRLRQRTLTSRELVQAYIDRIKEVNPYINAVIEDRFEEALKDAIEADKKIRDCSTDEEIRLLFAKCPILGIPFTVKESCGVKGMSHVVGSLKRLGKKAKYDCEPVINLRKAGGIPLLVSANPEYCLSIETNTLTHGRCFNPYDLRRTCGGSSGGEGALNACGATPFGVGSDISGSIRIPSLFNGIFGHKPTGTLLSNLGHFPNTNDVKCQEYLQMGPMTRFGTDLSLLLQIMSGDKQKNKLQLSKTVNYRNIKIYFSFGFDGLNGLLHPKVAFAMKISILRAVRYFKKNGIVTKHVEMPYLRNSTEIAMANLVLLRNFPYVMTDNNQRPTFKKNFEELIKSCFGYSKFTKEALLFELMRSTNAFMPTRNMLKYEREAELLKQKILALLDTNGVLFFPTFHVPAIPHNASILPLWGIDYCLIFNILGLPSTHIPMGQDRHGLPVGFQVIAAPMRDKLCFHIAEEIDRAFTGLWKPPAPHQFK